MTITTDAAHGFTSWGTGPFSAYNEMADSRSWWSMMSLFKTLTTMPATTTTAAVEESEETADAVEDESEDQISDSMDEDEEDDSAAAAASAGFSFAGAVAGATIILAAMQ